MVDSGCLVMSGRELERLEVVQRVQDRRLTQREASEILGMSERQVRRLCHAYRELGAAGLVSGKRGRPSNRRHTDAFRARVLELVRERYEDFGPTLAAEKLLELDGIRISRETLRSWMIADQLWTPRKLRRRVHQPRNRRECYGELVQLDGSDHRWFEDRGPRCTLLVYIDDATSRLMELRFCVSESAFSYFAATKSYLERHGKPVAFYSDKASVFRVSARKNQTFEKAPLTQFGRAMSDLNIDIICANTSQAKGRVERANLTLQDRLVKELRLAGISTMDEANTFAVGYVEQFNAKFGKAALSPRDAHRSLLAGDDLERVFTWQEERKVSKNLTLQFKKVRCLIESSDETIGLCGNRVTVCEWANGHLELWYAGKSIPFREFHKLAHVDQSDIVENKRLGAALEFARAAQRRRDEERLANPKVTLAQKQKIVEQWAESAGVEAPALQRRTGQHHAAVARRLPGAG